MASHLVLLHSDTTALLTELLSKRILIIDGAMGTEIQKYKLTADDFRGTRGCPFLLFDSLALVAFSLQEQKISLSCNIRASSPTPN